MSALTSSSPTPLPSPGPVAPRDLTSPSQIAHQLALLTKRESELSLELNALVSDRRRLDTALSRLRDLGGEVSSLVDEVDGARTRTGYYDHDEDEGYGGEVVDEDDEGLVQRVRRVWETSERVGGKVRRLDEEVGRVREATDIVTEVMELRNALQTMSAAIEKEDWEAASRACRRAMSVRKSVLEGGFAGAVVPTPQQPLPPPQLLHELRQHLLDTFRSQFDAAAARKDEQAVSRFFRLWPGIGAEEEGLEAYGDFVVGLVKARGATGGKASSPLYYLTNLTSLLESIAHIIDQHQPVVDKYYGKGRMRPVVGRLVGESDRVVRNLVEGWEEERRVGRLISETTQSRFSLLTSPALLPPLFPSLTTPSNQLSLASLATSTTSHLPNLSTASNLIQSYAQGGKRTPTPAQQATMGGGHGAEQEEEEKGPDPRDVDRVLGELVALGGRWALFRRFVWGRIMDDVPAEDPALEKADGGALQNGDTEVDRDRNISTSTEEDQAHNGLAILDDSGSQRAIENLLRVYYEPLEVWFLRMSIEKAHRLDSPDLSNRPHLSSLLDDTFYLLKLVLSRTLSCGSLQTLKSMVSRLTEVVERDYAEVIRRKMEGVYASGVGSGHSAGGGGGGERGEGGRTGERSRERDQREAFIIYLNDLDVSADYMERLVDDTLNNLPQVFVEGEMGEVRAQLRTLGELAATFRAACKAGLEQLFNQLTRPRLRPFLDDVYKDMTYALDEESFAEADESETVRKRFVRSWEGLVDGYRDGLTDHNYAAFFSLTVENLVRPWEKMILGMRFTELGAIRFERDVRGVANYLATQTSFGGPREKFTRLTQIGTVLNLDAEEDPEEFYVNSGIPWRISRAEYNQVIEQRQW